ncbi:uncharacterized protein CPUR_01496 [Claviceps purpurea 20.1]|uniref:Uncharacterized protein n=1 Tax=Claviceps purpurea (strain 20.1) TaxID=1111077 RepID=M1VUM3_CLAP2|nr:uncharacterized protein CPUR_01496 [Claviceps purpurea 20.1]
MENTLPQPDLGLVPVAKDLTVTAEHLGRCDTLPAAKGSGSRVRGMDSLMANMATFLKNSVAFEARFKALLQEEFAKTGTKIRVLDLNCGRCMYNGNVVDEDEPLEALYSMRTGQLIPDFPKNLRALDALPAQCVDALLIELDYSVVGRLQDRRRRLDYALLALGQEDGSPPIATTAS